VSPSPEAEALPERSFGPLLLGLGLVVLLALAGGAGLWHWSTQKPRLGVSMETSTSGPLGTYKLQIHATGTKRLSPWIYTAPQVSSGSSGTDEGYFVTWTSAKERFEFLVELGDDDSLIMRGAGEGGRDLIVSEGEGLLLGPHGARVLRGRDHTDLLPVLANPRLYVGARLVNSAPEGAAVDEEGRVVGIEVRVAEVYPGSPAELAGLEVGDALLSVESGNRALEIRSREGLARWWAPPLASSGHTLVFKVRRGEETLTISVKTRDRLLSEFREASSVSDDPSYLERH